MSWTACTLNDVCDKAKGHIQTGPFGSQLHQSDYSEEGTPVVMPKDIVNGAISEEGIARVEEQHVLRLSRHQVKNGDILFSRRGDVGRCAYISEKEEGWLCGTGCLRVTVDTDIADPKFVFYFLQQPSSVDWIEKHAIGATMLNLNTGILASVPLNLPDLPTQHRIASILSAYDDLIENNRRQIKLLEEAAQRLYREWFVELRFPGHESVKVVDGVPEGWTTQALCDIADVVMGQSPKSEFYNENGEGLPFHQGVGSYGYRFVIDKTFSSQFTRTAKAGSVLFSVRAPVGRLNYTKHDIAIGRGLAAMNHIDGCQRYLYYMLKERFFKDDILGNGSIFASISKDELLSQKFVSPTNTIMRRFEAIVQEIDRKIEVLDTQMELLKEARDRLLPKLMSGEIAI